jgi:hypothetical protein
LFFVGIVGMILYIKKPTMWSICAYSVGIGYVIKIILIISQ